MDDIQSIQAGPGPGDIQGSFAFKSSSALIKSQDTTLAVIEAAAAKLGDSNSDRMTLVLQKTSEWLEQLIEEWTGTTPGHCKATGGSLIPTLPRSSAVPTPGTIFIPQARAEGEPKPAALAKSQQRVEALEARMRLTEQELERERETTSQMRMKLAHTEWPDDRFFKPSSIVSSRPFEEPRLTPAGQSANHSKKANSLPMDLLVDLKAVLCQSLLMTKMVRDLGFQERRNRILQ